MNSYAAHYDSSSDRFFTKIGLFLSRHMERIVSVISLIGAVIATLISYQHGWILAYGDAESHINIAKNVVNGLTPGFAQLGGVWLPLTHLLMIPFVIFDPLWRTGLAGSIISGIFYVITCVYIFKLTKLITKNVFASFISFVVFATNLNILYLQTTPMTEIPLIAFFVLSTFYYVKYMYRIKPLSSILLAGLFAFCASLTRYDGWFLVICEALFIILPGLFNRRIFTRKKGDTILFATLAGFGIICWLVWCLLIFGDPFYFSDSIYSAKSQQLAWLQRNELPGYHNLLISLIYYVYTSLENSGFIIFVISFIGAIVFAASRSSKAALAILAVLFVPFIFNVISLFLGQSVIFIPGLTPKDYLFHLFNVRYGVTMIPFMAVFFGYLISRVHPSVKALLIGLLIAQSYFFMTGMTPTITLADGTQGLSAEKVPTNVENFINKHYDGGYVLLDSYARTISIAKSTVPMQDIIYVGNKPYWEISLKHPEKYAKWIIMQKNDAVWTALYDNPKEQGEVYKYFKKVYTSNNILIFERNS
ncbi:MAG TPA: hypothetical protein VLF93_07585 [Candidatus Saccharimonadales bacterium]|nr:hypothetical protein [Candidatus Saccharimonadales bacterium]